MYLSPPNHCFLLLLEFVGKMGNNQYSYERIIVFKNMTLEDGGGVSGRYAIFQGPI